MYEDYKAIEEILVSGHSGDTRTQLVQKYLDAGWILLGVQQRGHNDGETAEFKTAYVLGHTDQNAKRFKPAPRD